MTGMDRETLEWNVFREKCRRSFHFFFREFWDVNNREPLVDAPHIRVLCGEAERVVRRVVARQPKEYDLIINVPPGTSKSNIFSQALEAWSWTIDPTLQFITASHSFDLALALAVKSKDIILSDKYRHYFPEVSIRFDIKGKQWFCNTAGGYRYSCTPGISPTGRHAHLIIVDDPIDPKASLSDAERNSINEWFESTLPTRVVSKDISATILIMQRIHEDDPTGFLLKKPGARIRRIKLPGDLSDGTMPSPPELKEIYSQDDLLDPIRLSRQALEELKMIMGEYNYSGQIQQEPVPREGGLFKPEKAVVVQSIPGRIAKIVRSWDKAGTPGGGCFSAGIKMGILEDGNFIVLDSIHGQWRAEQREQIMLQTAITDGHSVRIVIEQEGGSGGKESAEATVRNLKGFTVDVDRPSGNKELRAEPFATQMNMGNVFILQGEWNKSYIDELRMFPRGKYKDQVDASSQAFSRLVSKKAIDYRKMMGLEEKKKPNSLNGIILP